MLQRVKLEERAKRELEATQKTVIAGFQGVEKSTKENLIKSCLKLSGKVKRKRSINAMLTGQHEKLK